MIPSLQSRFTRPPCPTALRWGVLLLALQLVGGTLGCAFGELRPHDPLQRQYSLEEMQERYTDLVRFGNFAMASKFIHPEHRKTFMDSMPSEDELRFLDYETDPFVLNEAMTESTVEVIYTAYSPWVLTQIELFETQTWSREEGVGNNWRVQSEFIGLDRYVKKRLRPTRPGRSAAVPAKSGTP